MISSPLLNSLHPPHPLFWRCVFSADAFPPHDLLTFLLPSSPLLTLSFGVLSFVVLHSHLMTSSPIPTSPHFSSLLLTLPHLPSPALSFAFVSFLVLHSFPMTFPPLLTSPHPSSPPRTCPLFCRRVFSGAAFPSHDLLTSPHFPLPHLTSPYLPSLFSSCLFWCCIPTP